MTVYTPDGLRMLLSNTRTIAVVGHSDRPDRVSYQIAQFLRERGYTVYPVNPMVTRIDGQPCYPTLADLPETVDLVNVFRLSEFLLEVTQEAITHGAKAVWAQVGVIDEAAAALAERAGVAFVMDRCIKVEYLNWM